MSADTKDLAEGLRILKMTQSEVGKAIPGWVEGEPEFVRTTFLALVCELMELLQLFNWKQWKQPVDVNRDQAADEFADVLAFLGYIVIFLAGMGVSTDDLATAYERKTIVNKKRLAGKVEGYGVRDGQSRPDSQGWMQGRLFVP